MGIKMVCDTLFFIVSFFSPQMLLLFFDKWVACVSKRHKLCSPQNKNLTDENNRHASVMRGPLQ